MRVTTALECYCDGIAESMDEFVVRAIAHPRLRESVMYSLSRKGKLLRPALCFLGYEAVGGKEPDCCLGIARAVEYIHNWTLVHDDIIDRSELRRGIPAVHQRFGSDFALLAGDALIFLALSSVVESQRSAPNVAGFDRVYELFSEYCIQLIGGEFSDVDFDTGEPERDEQYIDMIKNKTGVLLACSLVAGAMLAEAKSEEIAALDRYGTELGVAFQLRDDVLDVIGDPRLTGKVRGADLRSGKRNLIIRNFIKRASEKDRQRMESALGKPGIRDEEVARMHSLLERSGAVEYVDALARTYAARAQQALTKLEETDHTKTLRRLAILAANRDH